MRGLAAQQARQVRQAFHRSLNPPGPLLHERHRVNHPLLADLSGEHVGHALGPTLGGGYHGSHGHASMGSGVVGHAATVVDRWASTGAELSSCRTGGWSSDRPGDRSEDRSPRDVQD